MLGSSVRLAELDDCDATRLSKLSWMLDCVRTACFDRIRPAIPVHEVKAYGAMCSSLRQLLLSWGNFVCTDYVKFLNLELDSTLEGYIRAEFPSEQLKVVQDSLKPLMNSVFAAASAVSACVLYPEKAEQIKDAVSTGLERGDSAREIFQAVKAQIPFLTPEVSKVSTRQRPPGLLTKFWTWVAPRLRAIATLVKQTFTRIWTWIISLVFKSST